MNETAIRVTCVSTAAIKGTRLCQVDRIELSADGALGDRSFYVIDPRGRMVNGKQCGELQTVVAKYDREAGELTLVFDSGEQVGAAIEYGNPLPTRFFSHPRQARPLRGPWAEALSEHLGRPVRLVEAGSAVDRGPDGAASLISRASLRRLSEMAGAGSVDARRFRMLIELDGVQAHEEDRWVGRRVRVGAALVAVRGHVGRCLVTGRDPETGASDLPTLDVLGSYRREVLSTEPLPFGIHGAVVEPGVVRVGDAVNLQDG